VGCKLRTHRKLHRFLVSNTATDGVKFILDWGCAAIVRMNCNVVSALVMYNLPAGFVTQSDGHRKVAYLVV